MIGQEVTGTVPKATAPKFRDVESEVTAELGLPWKHRDLSLVSRTRALRGQRKAGPCPASLAYLASYRLVSKPIFRKEVKAPEKCRLKLSSDHCMHMYICACAHTHTHMFHTHVVLG